ncbi:MAG TPA: right-handed parallel beta-helix repeat-containing protein, partial [Solirubrobacteraceae bacterium]|nr:right-handed parallel beta-helix repeat-containing protein [Solirubrobacteraceae bacterium]
NDDVRVGGYRVRVGDEPWQQLPASARSFTGRGTACSRVSVVAVDRARNSSKPATALATPPPDEGGDGQRGPAPALVPLPAPTPIPIPIPLPPLPGGSSCEEEIGSGLPPRLPLSRGATYHVAPTGSDSNPGTEAAPWRTIQKAANTLRAGETALVAGGLYIENVTITRSGTATAPFTIRNRPGERPILRAGLAGLDNMPVQIRNAAYVRLQGLVFEGATGPSTTNIYASGSTHDVEISDCEVRNSARQGFFSERTTARIHIIGCHFHDNGGTGRIQQDHNIYVEGSHHALINNLIRNAPNGFGVQIYPSNDHIVVAGNTIASNFRDGIILGSSGTTTTSNALIVNNIITDSRAAVSTYWGGPVGYGNVARTNLAWGNTQGNFTGSGVTYENNRVRDPAYANPGAGDYRPRAGSAALDVAERAYVNPSDLDGTTRPQGRGPDLGAYER